MAQKEPVEIDSRWIRLVRSPVYCLVAAFIGISASFAPLYFAWAVEGRHDVSKLWFTCFQYATIALGFGALVFHLSLSCAAMKAIRVAHPASVRDPANRCD